MLGPLYAAALFAVAHFMRYDGHTLKAYTILKHHTQLIYSLLTMPKWSVSCLSIKVELQFY